MINYYFFISDSCTNGSMNVIIKLPAYSKGLDYWSDYNSPFCTSSFRKTLSHANVSHNDVSLVRDVNCDKKNTT